MKEISASHLYSKLRSAQGFFPLEGLLELTYRCSFHCVHCYCRGIDNPRRELTTQEWRFILGELTHQGCVYLTFSGGDPFIREDFLELYSCAKESGFIINVYTNGFLLNRKILRVFMQSPPQRIEITLNGITAHTYESITGVKGSFQVVMRNIKTLSTKGVALYLKTNVVQQNKHELARIKAFADSLLGKSRAGFHFGYDPVIVPRLDCGKDPLAHRLSGVQIAEVKQQDQDIWQEYQARLHHGYPRFLRASKFTYWCNSWMQHFVVSPYGRLRGCHFSDDFSVDLKTTSFAEGFYKMFPKMLRQTFTTNSKCQRCRLRPLCYYCPARAYLETGKREGPVPYYCELAKLADVQIRMAKKTGAKSRIR